MGELPFALAPEAALGAWLREAEREMEPHRTAGTYRGFDGTELPVAGRARRPAACPCGPPARVYGVSGKIP